MNFIKLEFNATECNGWPKINVLLDNDLYQEYQFTNDTAIIQLPVDLLDGEHTLAVELVGKNVNNTMVDSTGTIVGDQLVELLAMYVDNVRLTDFFRYNGIYTTNTGQVLLRATKWGFNGVWELKFKTPLITWVLDEQIKEVESHDFTGIPYHIYTQDMIADMEKITAELDKIKNV